MTVETAETTPPVTPGTPSAEAAEGAVATPDSTSTATATVSTAETPASETGEASTTTPEDAKTEGQADAGKEGSGSEFYFGGEQVEVQVGDDVRESLKGAGLDADKLAAELYRKDGDFSLTDETKAALYEKFPQPIVDSYLGMLKQQNESTLQQQADAKTQQAASAEQATAWAYEQVGGQEQWDAIQSWLETDDSVTDAQISSFNAAMESGNGYLQQLAIKDLHAKFKESSGDGGDMNLIAGEGNADQSEGALSRDDYHREMLAISKLKAPEKKAAQAKLDARRMAGIQKGI